VKTCSKCGTAKRLEDFYRATGTRDGYRPDCKACNLAAKHARYVANPGPDKARAQRWRDENPDRYAENQRRHRESGGKKIADRKSHLKRKYGMTLEDYDRMLEAQGGACAICGRPPREDIALHVDHDHETGLVRGLLCFPCNNTLGDFGDDPTRLYAAAEYLSRDPEIDQLIRRRVEILAASAPVR
jgi:hypothetical protein